MRVRSYMIVAVLLPLIEGCITPSPRSDEPSFATDLAPDDTDGILIEWRACAADKPCMAGDVGDKDEAYRLGFADSPSKITGTVGKRAVELKLDPRSVFRLGDHALELTFRGSGLLLALTWNELDQRLLDHDLVVTAD